MLSLIKEWEPKLLALSEDTIRERRNSQNRTIKQITGQNYQEEDWNVLIQLWKYTNVHIAHAIKNMNSEKLNNIWISGTNEEVSREAMVVDFPRHFKLHLGEIDELINKD